MTERRYPTSIEGVTAKAVYKKPCPGGVVGDRPIHVRVLSPNVTDIEKMASIKQNTGIKACVVTSQPTQNKEEEGVVPLLPGLDDIQVLEPEKSVPDGNSKCSKLCLWYIVTCCANTETNDD